MPDARKRLDRLEETVRNNVEPRIRWLTGTTITLDADDPDHAVIVLDIPDSLERPHMITFRGGRTDF